MSMHEKPTETTPMTQAEKLAQVVNNPESILGPVDDDLAKLHERLAASRSPKAPEVAPDAASAPEGVAGAAVHSRGSAAEGESYFGQLASEMVKPTPEPAVAGGTEALDTKKPRGRRRSVTSAVSAPVAQPLVPPAEKKPVKVEKEPIAPGKYLDDRAILCEVYRQGDDFTYKVLEGEDEGQIIPVGDESRMRALMGDEWKKVDDTTEPKIAEPAEPEEVKVAGLEQEEQLEGYELEEGQIWIKAIEFEGKKGHERIFIESISGDDIEMFREREFVGSQPWKESVTSSVLVIAKKFHDEEFILANKPPEKVSVIPKTDPELPPVDTETEKPAVGDSETGHFYPLANVGDTAVYDSADGKVTVLRTPEGYLVKTPGMNDTKTDERGVAFFAEINNWTRESQATSFSVDVNPTEKSDVDIELPLGEGEATPEQFLDNLPEGGSIKMKSKRGRLKREYVKSGDGFVGADGTVTTQYILELIHKNGWTLEPLEAEVVEAPKAETKDLAEPYQELFQGDIWVMRDEQGKFLKAFYINAIFRRGNGEQGVNVVELGEDLVFHDTTEGFSDVESQRGTEMDIEMFRSSLERNRYTRVTQGVVSENVAGKNVEPAEAEEDFGESQFVPLKNGETGYYRGSTGEIGDGTDEFFVRKVGWRYYVGYMDPKSEEAKMPRKKYFTLKEVHAMAQREQWVPFNPETDPSVETTMPKVSIEEPESEPGKPKSELDELRAKVQEERFAYVETDYLQNSAWSKIKNILRLGEEREDVDTQAALQRYKNALMQLQEAELEQVKKSNLSGDALKERLSGILMYVKYNEEVELMRSRNEVRIQKRNKWEKTVAKFEEVGRWYNGLSRTTKFAVAAGCGGLALAGGAIGGGSAAVVTGVLYAKRAVAGAGLAITLDTLAEGILDKRRLSKAQKEVETGLQADYEAASVMRGATDVSQESYESDFQALLSNNIQLQIEDIEKRFKNRKREALLRRSGAWAAAATATLGYSAYRSWFDEDTVSGVPAPQTPDSSQSDLEQALDDLKEQTGTPAPAEGVASVPEQVSSAPAAASTAPEAAASAAGQGSSVLPTPEPVAAPLEAMPGKVGTLLEKYDVTSADGKKGLWGIFEQRLPAGYDGDKNKAIQSLNNLVAEKVKGLSPEQLKEVGLRTNDINKIYPGDKIDFSKLLTKEEIQSVLDGKTIASPGLVTKAVGESDVLRKGAETAAQTLSPQEAALKAAEDEMIAMEQAKETASLNMAENEMIAQEQAKEIASLKMAEDQMIAQSKAEELASGAVRTAAAETKLSGNPYELKSLNIFFKENSDRIPEWKSTVVGIRQIMFETPDVRMLNPAQAVYFDYRLQPMMGKVDMLRVLEYSRDLRTGALQEFSFNRSGGPLHTSQIARLANLVRVAEDPKMFGTFGQVIRGESVEEYTRRIAALATATNKTPQLAMMLTGRTRSMI